VSKGHVTARVRNVSVSMGVGFALSLAACGGPATSADEEGDVSTQSSEIKKGLVAASGGSVKVMVWVPSPWNAWSPCSGVVSSRKSVITAAHCVVLPLGNYSSGYAWVQILRENKAKTFDELMPVTSVFVKYNPAYNGTPKNDVAVIQAPAPLSYVVQADAAPIGKGSPSGVPMWAFGYGYYDTGLTDGQGRIGQVTPTFSGTDYVFNATTTSPWMCSGDSGGGLKQAVGSATPVLYGIMSQTFGSVLGECKPQAHWASTTLNWPWLEYAINYVNCTESSTTVTCW